MPVSILACMVASLCTKPLTAAFGMSDSKTIVKSMWKPRVHMLGDGALVLTDKSTLKSFVRTFLIFNKYKNSSYGILHQTAENYGMFVTTFDEEAHVVRECLWSPYLDDLDEKMRAIDRVSEWHRTHFEEALYFRTDFHLS